MLVNKDYQKSTRGVHFTILPASLVPPNFMKFGIRGQLTDIIMCVKFLVDRFRGYAVLTPPKLPFPIDLLRRPYNSVRTALRHCNYLE